jgi:hypothetical protein
MTPITSLPACSRLKANALQVRFNLPKKFLGWRTSLMWLWLRGWKRRRPQSGQWWASVCSCLISNPNQHEAPTRHAREDRKSRSVQSYYTYLIYYTTERVLDGAWLDDTGAILTSGTGCQCEVSPFKLPRNNGNILLLCIYDKAHMS